MGPSVLILLIAASFVSAAGTAAWADVEIGPILESLEGIPFVRVRAAGGGVREVRAGTLLEPGDEFVAGRQLYGGSVNQFNHSFKKFGWNVVWADSTDPASFEKAITPKTKAIFCESIANPGGVVIDLPAISAIARKAGVPFIVDNTLATPYLCQPKQHGADIVLHSLTKFMGGHGNSIGGIIVDGGSFDWKASGKFPGFTEPDPSYHGLVFTDVFNVENFGANIAYIIKARVQGQRDIGASSHELDL